MPPLALPGPHASAGQIEACDAVRMFVEALLVERASARASQRYGDADRVRDALVAAGIEVRDSPDGTTWDIAPR